MILKTDASWRSEGSALFMALSVDQFTTPFGKSISHWPESVLRFLTLATFWFEILGPIAAFVTAWKGRVRMAAIVAFILFHVVALNLTFRLGLFPWVCAVGWLAFLPSNFWDEWLPRMSKSFQVPKLPNAVSRANPVINLAAAAVLLFVFAWNVRTTNFELHRKWFPRSLNTVARVFRVDQKWSMFAPRPLTDDGWFVAPAQTEDGKTWDLLTKQSLDWEKPEFVADNYPTQRWRKYTMNLRRSGYEEYRPGYLRYLIREFQKQTKSEVPLANAGLIYMRERTNVENHSEDAPRKITLYQSRRPYRPDPKSDAKSVKVAESKINPVSQSAKLADIDVRPFHGAR